VDVLVDEHYICLRETCDRSSTIGAHSGVPPWVEGRHNGGQYFLIVWTNGWRYLGDTPSDYKLRIVESIPIDDEPSAPG
jgi:hypothetical protein